MENSDNLKNLYIRIAQLEKENRLLKEKLTEIENNQNSEQVEVCDYEKILDSLIFGIQAFDSNGFSLMMNEYQRKLLGVPSKKTGLGQFNVLTDPYSVSQGAAQVYKSVYENKEPASREFTYNFDSKDNRWQTRRGKAFFKENILPILDENGKIRCVLSILTDVSQLRITEGELSEREHLFKLIYENSQTPIVFGNSSGDILMSNEAFNKLVGYDEDELTKINYKDLTYPDDYEIEAEFFRQVIEENLSSYNIEKRYVRKDGSIIWVDLTVSLIRDRKDDPLYVIATVLDINDKKTALEKLKNSEYLFRGVFENAVSAIAIADNFGNIIECNKSFESFIKLDRDELIGNNFTLFSVKSEEDSEIPFVEDLISGKREFYRFEKRFVRSDETEVWGDVSVSAVNDEIGRLIYFVAVITDITKRKQTENKLLKSEEFHRSLINMIDEGILIINDKYQMISFNTASKEILDFDLEFVPSEIEFGKSWKVFDTEGNEIPFEDHPSNYTLKTGNPVNNKILGIRKDDNPTRWISLNTLLIDDPENKEKVVLVSFQDITDLKNNEIQLSELNSTKDKFFSIIAHDLLNPLNTINGISQMMSAEVSDSKFEHIGEYTNIIARSSKTIVELLKNLLDWSRIQTGRFNYNPINFDINDVIERTVDLITNTSRMKRITISKDLKPNMILQADMNMIETTIRNILSNAIKFTYPGGNVLIRSYDDKKFVCIEIRDNGIGMSEEVSGRLFKIDKQATRKGTENEVGSGLGMILSNEFVKRHNGEIKVESKLGSGTKITIILPKK